MASKRPLRKFSGKKLLPKPIDTEGIASEGETAKSSFKHKRHASYASGDTNDFEFDNSDTESGAEPFSSPESDFRWRGTSLADRRSFDGAGKIYEEKGTNEIERDGIPTAFVAMFAFGGLFFLLLIISIFVFAW